MSRRLDDLFSVERLRRNWSGQGTDPSAEAAQELHTPGAMARQAREVAEQLKGLVHQRFSAERRVPLDALLQTLDAHLDRVFPRGADSTPEPEQLQELAPLLSRLFDDLEDMIEALELVERR
jgi:hypothetical protein